MAKTKKSKNIWLMMIVLPFAILFLIALVQMAVHFIFAKNGNSSNVIVTFVNVISVLFGMVAAISFICLPVWIIMLIKDSR